METAPIVTVQDIITTHSAVLAMARASIMSNPQHRMETAPIATAQDITTMQFAVLAMARASIMGNPPYRMETAPIVTVQDIITTQSAVLAMARAGTLCRIITETNITKTVVITEYRGGTTQKLRRRFFEKSSCVYRINHSNMRVDVRMLAQIRRSS